MGVLCDSQIEMLCEELDLVDPFDLALINPASIDLRVGEMARAVHKDAWQGQDMPLWGESFKLATTSPYLLGHGCTLLLDTLEYVRIPTNLMAEMWLKSSAGRNGIDTYKAGYVDPGFHGTLTFRITNQTPRPFAIVPGQRLVQMVLREMSRIPDRPYTVTGRYNGQRGPTEAR